MSPPYLRHPILAEKVCADYYNIITSNYVRHASQNSNIIGLFSKRFIQYSLLCQEMLSKGTRTEVRFVESNLNNCLGFDKFMLNVTMEIEAPI